MALIMPVKLAAALLLERFGGKMPEVITTA